MNDAALRDSVVKQLFQVAGIPVYTPACLKSNPRFWCNGIDWPLDNADLAAIRSLERMITSAEDDTCPEEALKTVAKESALFSVRLHRWSSAGAKERVKVVLLVATRLSILQHQTEVLLLEIQDKVGIPTDRMRYEMDQMDQTRWVLSEDGRTLRDEAWPTACSTTTVANPVDATETEMVGCQAAGNLPALPLELWMFILSFIPRMMLDPPGAWGV